MRKSNLIKAVALVVCVFMFATVMVGCGSSSSSSSEASTVAATTAPASSTPATATSIKDVKGTLNFWHFQQAEVANMKKAIAKELPNITFNVQVTPDTQLAYQNKLSAAIRANSGMPDALAVESAFAKKFINMEGLFDDLSAAPYNAADVTKNMIPYTVDIGKDKAGVLRALSHQATPGAIGYKRDVAKKYLGTDDPAAIADMISSEDKMLETAKKLSDASKGVAKLWVGFEDVYTMYRGARANGWVDKDGNFSIDPKMTQYIDFMKKMRDGKFEGAIRAWTPAWNAAIADDKHLLFSIPTWGIANIIDANDKTHKDQGRWGLAKAPLSFFWGGTWYGVYSKTQNKEVAWAFTKWFTADKDHLKQWAKDVGDFVNNSELVTELTNDDSFVNKTLNQNPYKVFGPMVADINGSIFTEQDDVINNDWLNLSETYLAGKLGTKDDFLKKFKDKVKSDFPNLKIQ